MEMIYQVLITAGMGLALIVGLIAFLFLGACVISSRHYESSRKIEITDYIGWFTTQFLFCLAVGALFRFG